MTPDMGIGSGFERGNVSLEYGYVNYHDSSGRAQMRSGGEPDISMTPARSILKNRQVSF